MLAKLGRFPHRALTGGVVMVFAFAAPIHATQVRPMNLEQITDRAATIFAGVCTNVRVERDPDAGWVRVATFDVARSAKGRVGRTATIRFPGGQRDLEPRSTEIVGMPGFRRGDEVVLFLYGTSAIGLTSPVGLGQGQFDVVRDKQGNKLAINAFGNERLLDGVTGSTLGRFSAAASSSHGATGIGVDALLDAVKALAKQGSGAMRDKGVRR